MGAPPLSPAFGDRVGFSFRAKTCFSIWMATAKMLRSGSLDSKCTCSGMTT
jgi:hypothetical protein